METKTTTRKPVRAVLTCCATKHTYSASSGAARPVRQRPFHSIEAETRGRIMYCDLKRQNPRFALAADRLRDWLTVHTLTAELDSLEAK